MYKPHHQSMNCTFLAFFSRSQGDCCMFSILMANISFLNTKSNPKTLETILYKFPPNHYCVARDSTHCCSGRAVFPWKIRHSADNTYNFKNQACRAEADLPQNTPGQSTPLTQQLCFPPLKWRSLISLFPGFLLPTSSASAWLTDSGHFYMLRIPKYLPNCIFRRCIKYLSCHRTHSDTELWAEKPSNFRPSQHGPWSLSKGQGCTRKLLSVKCSAAGTAGISNHQALAQNTGNLRFGINFCLFFLHQK